MRNYIHADMRRILSRASHTFSMLLLFGIYAAWLYLPNRLGQVTSVSLINSACDNLGMMILFIGLFEMIGVFSEDFKVKTMQVAIGLGITRAKVVICKLVEVVLLLILDAIVIILITLGVGGILGLTVPFAVLADLMNQLLVQGVIGCATYTSLTMIVLFATHSSVLSIFVYFLVGIDLVGTMLQLLPMLGFEWIESLRLTRFTLSHVINVFDARLALGTFDFLPFLGIMIYMAVGLVCTYRLFARRELDF